MQTVAPVGQSRSVAQGSMQRCLWSQSRPTMQSLLQAHAPSSAPSTGTQRLVIASHIVPGRQGGPLQPGSERVAEQTYFVPTDGISQ